MLGHMKTTREVGMVVICNNTPGGMEDMHVFADANFAPTGSAPQRGSVMFVEGKFISWKSRRQTIAATSIA